MEATHKKQKSTIKWQQKQTIMQHNVDWQQAKIKKTAKEMQWKAKSEKADGSGKIGKEISEWVSWCQKEPVRMLRNIQTKRETKSISVGYMQWFL